MEISLTVKSGSRSNIFTMMCLLYYCCCWSNLSSNQFSRLNTTLVFQQRRTWSRHSSALGILHKQGTTHWFFFQKMICHICAKLFSLSLRLPWLFHQFQNEPVLYPHDFCGRKMKQTVRAGEKECKGSYFCSPASFEMLAQPPQF